MDLVLSTTTFFTLLTLVDLLQQLPESKTVNTQFTMAAHSIPFSLNETLNSTGKRLSKSGSTLLFIRSYEEARTVRVFPVIISINLVVILLGIVINASICYVMFRKKRYKRNTSNFFIMHLSVMELVYRFLVFPIVIFFAVPSLGISTVHCKALSFFSKTCTSAIFLSLVAIAIDRYQNIVHPLESFKSKRNPVLLVFLVWLCAAVVSCPSVISVKSIPVLEIPEARGMSCDDCVDKKLCDIPQSPLGQSSATLYLLLAFLVPLVVLFVLYSKIVLLLHQRSHRGMMNKLAARSKCKAVRMLIIIVFAYALSLGPAVIFTMLRSYNVFNSTSFEVMLLVSLAVEFATYTSSLGNPLIYAYYNGDFRKELVQLLCKRKEQKENSIPLIFTNSSTTNYLVTHINR